MFEQQYAIGLTAERDRPGDGLFRWVRRSRSRSEVVRYFAVRAPRRHERRRIMLASLHLIDRRAPMVASARRPRLPSAAAIYMSSPEGL